MKVNGQLHATSALPSGKEPNWIGGIVSPRAGLDIVAKREILAPAGNQTLVIQPIASHRAIIAHSTSVFMCSLSLSLFIYY